LPAGLSNYRFLEAVIFWALTPTAGWILNEVIVGPQLISPTFASNAKAQERLFKNPRLPFEVFFS